MFILIKKNLNNENAKIHFTIYYALIFLQKFFFIFIKKKKKCLNHQIFT